MNTTNWHEKLRPYTEKSDLVAYWQVFSTLSVFFGMWYLYSLLVVESLWWSLPFSIFAGCLMLRFFVLMHDCGHFSLFSKLTLNKFFGYLFGVLVGMPQYVWSKHHAYHHKTNGDWVKYKGPLTTISLTEYNQLGPKQQKDYWFYRQSIFLLPGGFFYILFNPRFTWMKGLLEHFKNSLSSLFNAQKNFTEVFKSLKSKYWKTKKEFWHMTYNNLTLIVIWYFMISWLGFWPFFTLYAFSHAIAGGAGILFFTLQHNFEDSYASDTERVNSEKASIEGTSFLVFGPIMNWFTANIGFHHIHHLSVSIPNYQLKKCHNDLEPHFDKVKRIRMRDIPRQSHFLLWDDKNEKIISKEAVKSSSV